MSDNKGYSGIYIAYFSAEFGTSLGMFVFNGETVVGADIGGATYDGKLSLSEDQKYLEGSIAIRMDGGGVTITGAQSDLPVHYETGVRLKLPLAEQPYHEIQTVTGLVNVRFEAKTSL
jgi:hypothetical protein